MNPSKVIPDHAKDRFWFVVRDCLVEFHDMDKSIVRAKVNNFRKRVENFPEDGMELFYHSEPFDIACRIAKHRLNVDNYLPRYIEIRDCKNGKGSKKDV